MLINKILLFVAVISFTQLQINAQTSNVFSKYGLGTNVKSEFVPIESMGGISGAYNSLVQVNVSNPASYATLTRTTFEVGVYGQKSRLKSSKDSETQSAGGIQYFSLAFPIINNSKKPFKLGLATALLPNNKLDYDISTTRNDPVSGEVLHEFLGTGAINQALVGVGAKYKSFSLGFNTSYVFGNTGKARKSYFNDLDGSIVQYYFEEAAYKGFKFELGAQYEKILAKPKMRLRIGSSLGFKTALKKEGNEFYIRQINSGGNLVNVDTPYYRQNLNVNTYQPLTTNSGIILSRDGKWLVGANFKTWTYDKNVTDEINRNYRNAFLFSVGGEYIPEVNNTFNYLKTVRYRMGAFYGKDPLFINSNQMNTQGITFGLGLPIRKDASLVNIGAVFGNKGTTNNGLIQDKYMKFSIGITFNDLWFFRPKYD